MNTNLNVDPAELISAAHDLDLLADSLAESLAGLTSSLHVDPSGRDEVSVAAAHTISEVGGQFGADAATGVLELRKIAAVLRAQAAGFTSADDESAAVLRS